jgi:hypothetical protein
MAFHRAAASMALFVGVVSVACGGPPGEEDASAELTVAQRLERSVGVLAADSMEGRRTGSRGAARAAAFIAEELASYGVEPAFPSRFMQPVPMTRVRARGGRERIVLGAGETLELDPGWEILAPVEDVNVVGIIRGSHPQRGQEAIVVGAHFDHVGIGRAVDGDSIYNGADDDASGVAAVLEVARALAQGDAPERSVVFLFTSGEEMGLLGIRHYIQDPVVPLAQTVANLQVEMIGRPDSLAGGPGRAWLTGYERSTVGDTLAAQGIPLVADPRPAENFFFRSDNISFAMEGIPAHTLSSYNMHRDYHRPSDEAHLLDYEHMAQVVDATIRAVRLMANGAPPAWHEGGDPSSSGER